MTMIRPLVKTGINWLYRSFGVLFILSLLQCREVERSEVSKNLVEAKIQGRQIREALSFYKLDKGRFPVGLSVLGLSRELHNSNTVGDSKIVWEYSVVEDGLKCTLKTRDRADGYYVTLMKDGSFLVTPEKAPEIDDYIWAGGKSL